MTSSLCHCAAPADASEVLRPLFRLSPGFELLLASGSPRRRQFLNEWGLPFRLALPNAEEPRPLQGEPPEAYTRRAATAKALAVGQTLRWQATHKAADGAPSASPQPVILAADTVVAIGGDILGKPDNPAHALSMLARLNGASHEEISAVCLLLPAQPAFTPAAQALADVPASISYTAASASGNANTAFNLQETLVGSFCMLTFSDVSRVFFHHWPMPVLQAYVDTGEPNDKAGAYAIQGQGAVLVERVEGSWSTVVGLPVTALAQVMMDRGLILPCRC